MMFCLDPIHPLYTAILDVAAASPGIAVADLHKELRRRKTDVTLQHLYRMVNRMVEEQILLKEGTALSVNLMWLSYLQFFADRSKQALLDKGGRTMFPMKDGERRTFKVGNLLDLQSLWNHMLVQLHRTEPQKYLLKYYSHAWWQLGRHALDDDFYAEIRKSGLRCYWLFGGDTFLDRHAVALHEKLMDARLTTASPFPAEGYNLNVYGPYIFECVFSERITKHFRFLFEQVRSLDAFDDEVFSDIFSLPSPLTLKVRRDEKQALQLRAKIERFFLRRG